MDVVESSVYRSMTMVAPRYGVVVLQRGTELDGSIAKDGFMWYEWSRWSIRRRVKTKHDGLSMFVSHAESVVQVHHKCVAMLVQAVLDIGVQEPCMVEEVHGHDVDQVRRFLLLTGTSKTLWTMCHRNVATCKVVICQCWLVLWSWYTTTGLLLVIQCLG